MLEESPFLRMRRGLPVERLPDPSLEHAQALVQRLLPLRQRLRALEPERLSHPASLSYEILKRQLDQALEGQRFYWLGFEVTPYSSPIGMVLNVFQLHRLDASDDRQRYLNLLDQVPDFVHRLQAKLEGQAQRGIRMPRDEIELAQRLVGSMAGRATDSPFWVGEQRLAGLPPEQRDGFQQQLRSRIEGRIEPAVQRLLSSLSGAYREQAPDTVGLGQYPEGPAYYAFLVRSRTTLERTPEQVHRIGLEEVETIERRMREVRERLGFTGGHAEFKERLRTDPRFFPATPEAIGERLMSHIRAIEPAVERFFLRRPRAPYGVRRLELRDEPGQTFGHYEPPTADRPEGLYRFNGSNLSDRSLFNAGALIYHELVPGHHFQICLALENDGIPAYRRELMDTAYVEGWGHYAAQLAEEMGMYQDPYDLYGLLNMDMFLSVRLVVDSGMNAMGWSRERAMQFMRERLMETETQIRSETLRYAVDIPGQALAYKMGSRRLWELRARAQQALGERFDLRRFHDAVLSGGSMPLSTLERHVDWFIGQERARWR
jgi:uncharacterized protein (DUF885 family)